MNEQEKVQQFKEFRQGSADLNEMREDISMTIGTLMSSLSELELEEASHYDSLVFTSSVFQWKLVVEKTSAILYVDVKGAYVTVFKAYRYRGGLERFDHRTMARWQVQPVHEALPTLLYHMKNRFERVARAVKENREACRYMASRR